MCTTLQNQRKIDIKSGFWRVQPAKIHFFRLLFFWKKHQKTVKNHVFTGTKVNVQKLEKSAFFGDESAAVFSKIFSKFTKLLQTFANFVQNVTKCVMSTFSKSSWKVVIYNLIFMFLREAFITFTVLKIGPKQWKLRGCPAGDTRARGLSRGLFFVNRGNIFENRVMVSVFIRPYIYVIVLFLTRGTHYF